MRIGLIDVDSKRPNLALMKISAWHKAKNDIVEFYNKEKLYDKIYASKVFVNSVLQLPKRALTIGGSGYDLNIKLPYHIEHIYPDYDLYGIDYAMGFITRGCIRKCPFCIVPEKEGFIQKNAELEEFCKDQEKVLLLDNNILSYKNHLEELEKLAESKKRFDFNQGLDIRLINKKNAKILRRIKRWKGLRLRFALDEPNLIPLVEEKIKILNDANITNGVMQFYVLIGFNTTYEEDLKRIEFLKSKNISAFAMPFVKNDYTKNFARWVNRFFYKYQTFQEYLKL